MNSDHPERHQQIVNIPGQFHCVMDDFKAKNCLFEEVLNCLLGPIFGGDLKRMGTNFTKFSDPTVPEKQLSSLLLAIHVHVIWSMVCAGKSAFSVVEMHDCVKETSVKRPLAMLIFTLLLHHNVTFMHPKTMRDNDLDGFLSAVRLSISKHCVTHSTSCLRSSLDLLQWWHACSDCKQRTHRNTFTGQSENGANVARDFIHEKCVRAMQQVIGKIYRPGRDQDVEWASLSVMDRAEDKRSMEHLRAGGYFVEDRTRMFFFKIKVFANATIVLEDIGVFHQLGNLTTGGKTHAHDKLCSPHDGSVLTAELLKIQSMGQTRADEHATKCDLETQGQNTRTEKGMGMPEIKSAASKTEVTRKKVTERITVTTKKGIEKSGADAELLEEIKKFERYDGITVPDVNSSVSKSLVVDALCQLRRKVFRQHMNAKEESQEEALQGLPSTSTSPEERRIQLQSDFFISARSQAC